MVTVIFWLFLSFMLLLWLCQRGTASLISIEYSPLLFSSHSIVEPIIVPSFVDLLHQSDQRANVNVVKVQTVTHLSCDSLDAGVDVSLKKLEDLIVLNFHAIIMAAPARNCNANLSYQHLHKSLHYTLHHSLLHVQPRNLHSKLP